MNTFEILENFFYTAYVVIDSQDEIKINIIKEQMIMLIKQLNKKVLLELLSSHFTQIYYIFLHNKIYQEVNKNNLDILNKEIKIVFFLKKNFKNQINDETILSLFVQLLEYILQIDFTRIEYIHENTNLGRSILSTNHFDEINRLFAKEEKIQKTLKRNLNIF